MFMVYVLSAFLLLIGLVSLETKELQPPASQGSDVYANHMIAWHKAAVERCAAVTCTGGTISAQNIADRIPEILRNSPTVTRRSFTSNYDNGSTYVLTFMPANAYKRADVSYASVASSFASIMGSKSSSSVGRWNAGSSRIELTNGVEGKRYFRVPTDVPANALVGVPDQSPVLFTKAR